MDIVLFVSKMNEAFEILTERLQEVAETLNQLFVCFGEEKKKDGIFPKSTHQIRTKSFYKPPFVQVPRHLAYQRRHYQS